MDKIEAWLSKVDMCVDGISLENLGLGTGYEARVDVVKKLLSLVRIYREANQLIANTELEKGTLRGLGDVIRFEYSFWKVQLQARAAENKAKEILGR